MKRHLLALLLLPLSAWAEGGLPSQPYCYAEGTGAIERAPDLVTLSFSLGAHEADQATANKKVQAQSTKVLAMLDDRKIARQDVVAEDLHSEAEYENANEGDSSNKRGALKGYVVTRKFSVIVRSVASFPKIVDELLTGGVEEFAEIEPGLTDQAKLTDEVWQKAVADARERAEKTLKAEKMKIDSLYAISPTPIPEISSKLLGGRSDTTLYSMSAADKLDATQYRLAPVRVEQTIHVIYLISPAK